MNIQFQFIYTEYSDKYRCWISLNNPASRDNVWESFLSDSEDQTDLCSVVVGEIINGLG